MTPDIAFEILRPAFTQMKRIGYAGPPQRTKEWQAIQVCLKAGIIYCVAHFNAKSADLHMARDRRLDRRVFALTPLGKDYYDFPEEKTPGRSTPGECVADIAT